MAKEKGPSDPVKPNTLQPAARDKKKRLADALRRNLAKRKRMPGNEGRDEPASE